MSNRIKITQTGWEGYTGDFCGMDFVNGVSVHPVPRIITDRIAANVSCVVVNAEGETEGFAGEAARMVEGAFVGAAANAPLARASQDELDVERAKYVLLSRRPPADRIYTPDELITIGEQEGLNGLRKLALPWNVKGRSIEQVITAIVKAQSEFTVRKAESEIEQKAARDAAHAAALAKQAEAEDELTRQGRLLSNVRSPVIIGLSNAIDPTGKNICIDPNATPSLEAKIAEKIEFMDPSGIITSTKVEQ